MLSHVYCSLVPLKQKKNTRIIWLSVYYVAVAQQRGTECKSN